MLLYRAGPRRADALRLDVPRGSRTRDPDHGRLAAPREEEDVVLTSAVPGKMLLPPPCWTFQPPLATALAPASHGGWWASVHPRPSGDEDVDDRGAPAPPTTVVGSVCTIDRSR